MNPANMPVASTIPYIAASELKSLLEKSNSPYRESVTASFNIETVSKFMTDRQKVEFFDLWAKAE